jgi:hypothetical protein
VSSDESDSSRDNVRMLLLQGRLDEIGFAQAAEGLRLIRAFGKIASEDDRRIIIELTERLGR